MGAPGLRRGRGAPCGPAAPPDACAPDRSLQAPRPPASHLGPERAEERRELEQERGPRAGPPGRARHSPRRRRPHGWPGPSVPPGNRPAPARPPPARRRLRPRLGQLGARAGAQPQRLFPSFPCPSHRTHTRNPRTPRKGWLRAFLGKAFSQRRPLWRISHLPSIVPSAFTPVINSLTLHGTCKVKAEAQNSDSNSDV